MTNLKAKDLVSYAVSKVNTPYFYGCRMEILTNTKAIQLSHEYPSVVTPNYLAKAIAQGQINVINTDCSGLIYGFTKKDLSSSALYQKAYTRLPVDTYNKWADGVITWRNGHVGVFYHNRNGDPIVVEAKGINYGTVFSKFIPSKWTKGLTFSWMDYDIETNVASTATWREGNPYNPPTAILRLGSKGEGVKWLQWELIEAGEDLSSCGGIDGVFGKGTLKAVESFQQNSLLLVDGEVGPKTRDKLLLDKGENK